MRGKGTEKGLPTSEYDYAEIPDIEVEKVWNIVTSLDNYSWRSDIDKIVVIKPEKQFEEHTKDGYIVGSYLKKQQSVYIQDLKRALGMETEQ